MSVALTLDEPLIRAVLVPFAASAAAVILIRYLLGEGRGSVLANAGIGLGLLAGMAAVLGAPSWPPTALMDKAALAAAAGLAVGALTDRFQIALPLAMILLIGWPVLTMLWFVASEVSHLNAASGIIKLGLLIAGAVILFTRLDQVQDQGAHAPLLLLLTAAALALVAYIYGLGRVAETAAACGAAVAGYLLWNIPVSRYPLGNATILSMGSVYLALATALLVLRDGAGWALLAAAAGLFAHDVGSRVLPGRPAVMTILAGGALPLAATAAVAYFTR